MTISVRPAQLSLLGIIAGVAAIPIAALTLIFAAAKLMR
jgi:hypothetical protein